MQKSAIRLGQFPISANTSSCPSTTCAMNGNATIIWRCGWRWFVMVVPCSFLALPAATTPFPLRGSDGFRSRRSTVCSDTPARTWRWSHRRPPPAPPPVGQACQPRHISRSPNMQGITKYPCFLRIRIKSFAAPFRNGRRYCRKHQRQRDTLTR